MDQTPKYRKIMAGCIMVLTSIGEMLIGCPAEVLKNFMINKLAFPRIIVLPSLFYNCEVVQAAIEFPIYYFLFILQGYFKGEKLTIVGTQGEVSRMEQIIRLTLLGPTKEQMIEWGIPEKEMNIYLKLSQEFGLKKFKTTTLIDISDIIRFIAFDNNGVANVDGVLIERKDSNLFNITDGDDITPVDINIYPGQQHPPIPVKHENGLSPRPILGATALSDCTNGFDPNGYTTGIVFWVNGMGITVDGVAYGKEHMKMCGISHSEIFLETASHLHEDHANFFDRIINGQKFHFMGPRIIYKQIVFKAALTLDISESEVEKMIIWHEASLDKPNKWCGAELKFIMVAHPVPTFGLTVTLNGKSMVFSGDTVWGTRLKQIFDNGVIDQEMYDTINGIPYLQSELTFMDCGGKKGNPIEIHPVPEEVAMLPPQILKSLVPTHLGVVPEEVGDKLKKIKAGQSWVIIEDKSMKVSDVQRIQSSPIFANLPDEWMNTILAQGTIREARKGDVVLNIGQTNDRFFLILGGTVQVLNENGEEQAVLSTHDLFGEMSMMYSHPVSASIVCKSDVRLLTLEKEIFTQLINSTGLRQKLEKVHQYRPFVLNIFKGFQAGVVNSIIELGDKEEFSAGSIIIKKDSDPDKMYAIVKGVATVHANDSHGVYRRVATLYESQIFGEISLIEKCPRTADVLAKTDVTVFSLSREAFELIIREIPSFRYSLTLLARERTRANIEND